MKRLVLSAFAISSVLTISAQTVNTVSTDNYVTQTFKNVFVEMPAYRQINSGTKIIVTYEGEWPEEMKGAFEYAVKMWEEVLPMALPIRITAKVGNLRSSGNLLSRVAFDTFDFNGGWVSGYSSPMTMIKSVLLQDYHYGTHHRYCDEITDTSIFEGTDLTITYNVNMIDQCDFSLDGEANLNKYDFVTVALRDIAIGLGFTTSFTADTANKKLNVSGERMTPFECLVMEALATSDPYTAYTNATKGSLEIPLRNWGGIEFGKLSLYAPKTWSNGSSLRFMIPNSHPLSRLLTYDFGKGYVMRDLSGVDWYDVFCGTVGWRKDIAVGSQNGTVSNSGTSNDVLPYKGQVTLSFNGNYSLSNIDQPTEKTETALIVKSQSTAPADLYCRKYDSFSPTGPSSYPGLSLSVLKKDGSWDRVYTTYYSNETITLNIENLTLNYGEEEYARSTSGGLRYRLTKCLPTSNYNGDHYYTVKYFTRDFTPQKANIKYTPETTLQSRSALMNLNDDGFVDVKVGLRNIEGATKVIVEQLDEGETLPFQYEVKDFRKGYFIANLDTECDTQLTVISYNANGYKRSNTIVIPAIEPLSASLSFIKKNGTIEIMGLDEEKIESGRYSYSLQNLSQMQKAGSPTLISDKRLEIGSLNSGIYLLTVSYKNRIVGEFKFVI